MTEQRRAVGDGSSGPASGEWSTRLVDWLEAAILLFALDLGLAIVLLFILYSLILRPLEGPSILVFTKQAIVYLAAGLMQGVIPTLAIVDFTPGDGASTGDTIRRHPVFVTSLFLVHLGSLAVSFGILATSFYVF